MQLQGRHSTSSAVAHAALPCSSHCRANAVSSTPQPEYLQQTMALQLTLTAEDANKNLHKFRGKAQISDPRLADSPAPNGSSPGQNGSAGAQL